MDGPVPNTIYVYKGAEVISEGDHIELTPDALNYYEKNADKRKEIADEAHADSGEGEFKPGGSESLRVTWMSAQNRQITPQDV